MAVSVGRGTMGLLVLVPVDWSCQMPKPIIAAIDPDSDDDAPLVAGAALARITGARLMVLGVYLHGAITNAVSAGTVDEDRRANALGILEARTSGMDADLFVTGGSSAARVVHDAAVELDAVLVVVGSTRRGPVGRVAPGTTAERLMHGAPCPVVIVPAGLDADWSPDRIAVGFVDLEDGRGALRAAAALSRAVGAELRPVTAVEPAAGRSAAVAAYGAGGQQESRAIAQRELDAALAELPSGVRARGEVVVAPPAEALVVLSEDVDLLVCGSRGYGPLRAVLMGSVSHAVIRRARCPVVVVPRGTDNAISELAPSHEATTG
jgi:nucleotide-binding universal stress UspA family protein